MTPEGKQALISALRRVVIAGLVLIAVWLLLLGLRGAIPQSTIDQMSEQIDWEEEGQSLDPSEWDWSRSLWTSEPISEIIGRSMGHSAWLLGMGGLLSFIFAGILLSLGVLISRITEQPPWLAKTRSVLRLVLVTGGVSVPVYMLGVFFLVIPIVWLGWEYRPPATDEVVAWLPVLYVSILPAWLLVQAGHGELTNYSAKINVSYWPMARDLAIRLVIRLLKMAGIIIVVSMLVERSFGYNGLGRIFIGDAMSRDFPVLFGLVWVFALIVVLSKLAAELIEIAYNHFGQRSALPENEPDIEVPQPAISKGWLIFSLALVVISLLIAFIGPPLAPYGYNEVNLDSRLAPPSSEHILGGDSMGRDIFSRLLFGFRNTLATSLLAVGIMAAVAVGWASLVAHLRRANNRLGDTLADLVMLPRDILSAFPWLVLLLLIMSMRLWGELWQIALVMSLVLLPCAVSMMREMGSHPPAGRSWLYGIMWSIPVMLLLTTAGGILYVSTLSYWGFGVPPPIPELGSMVSVTGMTNMRQAPWMVQWPIICLISLLFIWVMAGDALLEKLGFRSKAVWVKALE